MISNLRGWNTLKWYGVYCLLFLLLGRYFYSGHTNPRLNLESFLGNRLRNI